MQRAWCIDALLAPLTVETARMELLLLSNSTNFGSTMFHHASEAFRDLVAGDTVTFVPFALADWYEYSDRVSAAFSALGIAVVSAHRSPHPAQAILDAEVVMVGGGNSFRLLDSLHGLGIVDDLGDRVRRGATRYLGSSAGTNITCPTIRTTNDMPICEPTTLKAMNLLPFQINLHYVDVDPASTFMGENRDERIAEFLEENDCPVLALYEGSWLNVSGKVATVTGPARLFHRGGREDFAAGGDVSHLLSLESTFGGGRRPVR
jgi:dipeptidase E